MTSQPNQCDIDAYARILNAYNTNKKAIEKAAKKSDKVYEEIDGIVSDISGSLQADPVKLSKTKADAAAKDIVKLLLECV